MRTSAMFAFAILLPFVPYQPHHQGVNQTSSDDEMYEVYSAAIRDLFLRSDESTNPDGFRANLVVIGDHTISYRWDDWNDPTKTALKWAKSGVRVGNGTVKDFKRKCKDSIPLETRFALPKQVLISDQELDNVFGNFDYDWWERFYKRFPNSVGYVSLSRVGFNLSHDQAFLYVALGCGNLCGSGYYVLVAKDKGAWSVKHTDPLWVS